MENQQLVQFLERGIQHVRLAFVDTTNTVRLRIIPIAKFLKSVASGERRYFMSKAVFGLMLHEDHLPVGLPSEISCRGEMCLIPDLTNGIENLSRLPYGSGTHTLCLVDLEEKDYPGVIFGGCPRSSLKNIIKTANEELGLSFLVGFEIEVFFLQKQLDRITPIDNSTYASSIAMRCVNTSMMIDEIVQSIFAQGIEISHFHPESGPGQFEFVIDPYDPLTAADNLVRTRETIYNIAAKYDLHATLAPKVFADYTGSGSHCHISLSSSKVADSPPGPLASEGLTSVEENFLAGILKHIRSICAFTLPNVTSYNRTKDNWWAGCYICWGIDNREASVRLAYTPGDNRKFRFEVKSVDGTANPYLAVSAIIVAGLDGIRKNLKLDQEELTTAPSQLGLEEQNNLIPLPTSIEEALTILEQPTEYEIFRNGMGKTLVDIFITLRKADAEYMRTLRDEEQLKLVIKTF